MKTVKPFRLAVLTRPYRWQRRDHLGVTVMAMSTLGDDARVVLEQELWKSTAQEVGAGAVLDLAVPKLTPEVLVSGYAYTNHQEDKSSCAVKLQVAELQKSLTVFGDRYWLGGRPTPPQAFEKIRMDWQHAYGGPSVADNPVGMGSVEEMVNGVHTKRLAHIEAPGTRPVSPKQAVAPVGFGAIPPDWPQRMSLMGTQYGKEWLENDFPGFAKDIDWRCFNAAPADQRWEGRQEVPPGASYELWNMHPEHPVLRGNLPRWRARSFVRHTPSGGDLREVPMRLTTAWFFPHLERVALLWHGVFPIIEDDAADIELIMAALERSEDAPRPMAHYESVLRLRLDPERGAIHALRDSDLMPKELLSDWGTVLPDVMGEPLPRNMRAGQLRDHEQRREQLRAQGLDPDHYLPPLAPLATLPDIDDLPEFLGRLDTQAREAKAQMEAIAKDHLPEQARPFPEAQADDDGEDEPLRPGPAPADGVSALTQQAHLHGAHLSRPASPAPSFRSAKWRRRLAAADPAQRDFSRLNLAGVDLSGMDLRGARFVGASLEDANLQGAQLDGCDFSQAVLARAQLSHASMARAHLFQANLGGARCEHTVFDGAALHETNCSKTHFDHCQMVGASFELTQFHEAALRHCNFAKSHWRQVALIRLALEELRFDEASFNQMTWIECRLQGVSFVGAHLLRCGFVTTDCSAAVDFSQTKMEGSSFAHGSTLAHARFRSAHFKECGLRTTPMAHADLSDAWIENSDLSECDLSHATLDRMVGGDSLFIRAIFAGASLREANLIDANLAKADLRGADLARANLFRADVSQTRVDALTRTEGAYTQHAKVWPARRPEAPAE
ncbi:Secreted effector protein pipB2 [compost metagenome]